MVVWVIDLFHSHPPWRMRMKSDEEYKNGSKKGAGGCSTKCIGYKPRPPKVGGTHPAASQNKSAAVGWAGGFTFQMVEMSLSVYIYIIYYIFYYIYILSYYHIRETTLNPQGDLSDFRRESWQMTNDQIDIFFDVHYCSHWDETIWNNRV